ncbi:MAG: hypothetical protein C0621_10690 [Desulfuromonas sp.]|nr:MAG: hypothetical protein C0621_10690 [Desulfuromonas sp.]
MRAVGLITEYNPFHNGHLHHLHQSLKVSAAEVSVAVMSGHFLQRGEAALLDKWCRTEMALAAGVDVVVELPLFWACNSAPCFAEGGVQTLSALGVETFCFGSESGTLSPLMAAAEMFASSAPALEAETRRLLRQGVSYPLARAQSCGADAALSKVIAAPNNLLGIEYLLACRHLKSSLIPLTISRCGAGYHDLDAEGAFASATGIRQRLAASESVAPYVPPLVARLLDERLNAGLGCDQDRLFTLIAGRILRGSASLRPLYQVEAGIEERLFAAAQRCDDLEKLCQTIKARHLTRTRLQRLLIYLLLELTAAEMSETLAAGPLYLHLLGCSPAGQRFLAASRKKRDLPLVGNYSRVAAILKKRYGSGEMYRLATLQLELERRATRLYTLLLPGWRGERERDFYEEFRLSQAVS